MRNDGLRKFLMPVNHIKESFNVRQSLKYIEIQQEKITVLSFCENIL